MPTAFRRIAAMSTEEIEKKRLLRWTGWVLVALFFLAMFIRQASYFSRAMDIAVWVMLICGIVLIRSNRIPLENNSADQRTNAQSTMESGETRFGNK
jgi:hypothetical protein